MCYLVYAVKYMHKYIPILQSLPSIPSFIFMRSIQTELDTEDCIMVLGVSMIGTSSHLWPVIHS